MPPKNSARCLVYTNILASTSYIKALIPRASDTKLIPVFCSDHKLAMNFMTEANAQQKIKLLVNPSRRVYKLFLSMCLLILTSCKVQIIPNAERVYVRKWKGAEITLITVLKTDSGYTRLNGKPIPAKWKRYCKEGHIQKTRK